MNFNVPVNGLVYCLGFLPILFIPVLVLGVCLLSCWLDKLTVKQEDEESKAEEAS